MSVSGLSETEISVDRLESAEKPDQNPSTFAHTRPTSRFGSLDLFVVLSAIALWGGYCELLALVIKKQLGEVGFWYLNKHFFWRIPLATTLLLAIPGIVSVGLATIFPRRSTFRLSVWIVSGLAVLGVAFRTPLHPAAAALFSIGAGSALGLFLASVQARTPKLLRFASLASIVCLAIALFSSVAYSLANDALVRRAKIASLPTAPAGKNVVFIVLDAVRAQNLSLYGHSRRTTPNLERWAKKGVAFDAATSPASWTLPSHISMFTGYWPHEFDTNWDRPVVSGPKTIAELMLERGYATFGIAGNTGYCSYETGVARGFIDFEDYSPSLLHFSLESSVSKRLMNALYANDDFARAGFAYQARDAMSVNSDFLAWLDGSSRPAGRPFFAFINYMDAHEPFVTPNGSKDHFGATPEKALEHELLLEWRNVDKTTLSSRDLELARDGYDDCIRFLDDQVGKLLDHLERSGTLENTVVVIASDHGESLGEHDYYNHGSSVYMTEVHVPLLIIAPGQAPQGVRVSRSVSLRDMAATLFDLSQVGGESPVPGVSLTRTWRGDQEIERVTSPALSVCREVADFTLHFGKRDEFKGTLFSLVGGRRHFIRDDGGREALFDLDEDPNELRNRAVSSSAYEELSRFRSTLHKTLKDSAERGPYKADALEPFISSTEAILPSQYEGNSPEDLDAPVTEK